MNCIIFRIVKWSFQRQPIYLINFSKSLKPHEVFLEKHLIMLIYILQNKLSQSLLSEKLVSFVYAHLHTQSGTQAYVTQTIQILPQHILSLNVNLNSNLMQILPEAYRILHLMMKVKQEYQNLRKLLLKYLAHIVPSFKKKKWNINMINIMASIKIKYELQRVILKYNLPVITGYWISLFSSAIINLLSSRCIRLQHGIMGIVIQLIHRTKGQGRLQQTIFISNSSTNIFLKLTYAINLISIINPSTSI